jgi:multiple sugar transport system ATP-binding protein
MDEPLSNLDAKLRTQTRMEISKLHSELKTTMVYVTHDQTEAMTMGTRIVVMDKGRIQQVAPPQQLYDHPTNMFVAGFIGSPQMNFINGSILSQGSEFFFDNKRFRIVIPESFYPFIRAARTNLRQVVMGIRPEYVVCDSWALEKYPDWQIAAAVDAREPMGSNTFLYAKSGEETIISRTEAHTPIIPGDNIKLVFRMDYAHFFDKDSGVSLTARGVITS